MGIEKRSVGILTFHCSDNYGALLQAYGLKRFLRMKKIKADIIPYEPPFMTGRHWWFPYVPGYGWKYHLREWKAHLRMGIDFFRQKANMRYFRNEYLLEKGARKLFFACQLDKIFYPYYIVGSDQIWNPGITLGLRKEYFGVFYTKREKKVIAYAASLGGASLPEECDRQFAELISHVDAVSVREEKAVPYIERFYQGTVTAVLDPVFLLKEEEWRRIEKASGKKGYILVYSTEYSRELYDYAEQLSQEKTLQVIELKAKKRNSHSGWYTDYTAGPAEFLGYIHGADYVVTNSFHAVAFSIIYRKQFVAFIHSTLGARIENIMNICGVKSRIYQPHRYMDIDSVIDWEEAGRRMSEKVKLSEDFLRKNLPV